MITTLPTITIEPDSELARVLRQASETPLVVATNGARYRVIREADDPFAGYDPTRVQAGADRAFGSLRGVDVEGLLAELREQRAQDSQGRPA